MTDCPNGDIRDLLPDLLHGRLDALERAEVEAHLRSCEPCREELELLRTMRSALRRAPVVQADRIVAGIPRYSAPIQRVPARSWSGWRVAAAVTLLAAGGTSVVVARHEAPTAGDRGRVVAIKELDSMPRPAQAQSEPDEAGVPAGKMTAGAAAPRELAFAGGTIGELDDKELSTLIDDIGSLDAVTPVEVDNGAAAGPIAPTSPRGMNN